MMKRIITLLTLSVLLLASATELDAQVWKTKKQKESLAKTKTKKEISRYDKLFKDKTVETARGVMTIHKVGDKIYVEFPLSMLGRDMMLTSSIESTSDAGEGYPGQFGGRAFRMHFTLQDSTLQARTSILSVPINSSEDASIDKALEHSTVPAIYKSFKVLAYNADSTAVVVDMKKLFFESSTFTKPFPANSANAYYGFVSRTHRFQNERSRLLGVKAITNGVAVRGEMSFLVDHTLMGTYPMYEDVPLTAVINKMLVTLPETPMRARIADSRIGLLPIMKADFEHPGSSVKAVRYARRWNIQPKDSARHRAGELCEVTKPVCYYMDTLLPQSWKQYIKEGAMEWNKAFEKIGFKDVISVVEFPKDSLFDANDINNTTIRFAPTWSNSAQVTLQSDARTGEIVNASISIGGNMVTLAQYERLVATMGSDPRVRVRNLPEDLMGEMIKANIMQAVGESLGFTRNLGASSSYPVDSLRSVTFTSKYGLSSSVMDEVICNRIATEDDVKRGVALVNHTLGEYDYYAVKWLYSPIYDKDYKGETSVLDSWIKEHNAKAYAGQYVRSHTSFPADPRTAMEGLGDDYIKEMKYLMPILKYSYANYFKWFADEDKNFQERRRLGSSLYSNFMGGVDRVLSYVGGIYLDDVRQGEGVSYRAVPRQKQKEALAYAVELMKDLSWLEEDEYKTQYEVSDDRMEKCRFDLFRSLFIRLSYVEVCAERSSDPYTANEYLDDMYKIVWSKTLAGTSPDYIDQQIQIAFLNSIIGVSSVTSNVGKFKAPSSRGITLRDSDVETAKYLLKAVHNGVADASLLGENSAEQISGYGSIRSIKVDDTDVSSHYFSVLLRMKDMLKGAVAKSGSEDRKHYTMLLYKIEKALEIK